MPPSPQQLFGRLALKKGYLAEGQLARGLRFQEEIRNLGLRKQLGEILLSLGSLTGKQVETIVSLQAINERAGYARRYGRIAYKNELIDQGQFGEAFEIARAERFQRSLSTILQERGYLNARHARAITTALDRVLAESMGRTEPERVVKGRETDRFSQALEVEEDEEASVARRRVADLTFAAVALREGMILVPELERAAEEQLRRDDGVSLQDLLIERGVLAREEAETIASSLEASRQDRLRIRGYQVLDVLGFGITSIVLRARHEVLEREVAIKLLHADYAADAEAIAEEAKAIAAVEHPNVVGIYEVGRVHRRVYYVMELVDGPNLTDDLRERGALGESEAIRLARDLLSGLAAIHEHGLVHRDVKPLNVLIATDGTAKLTDLGLVTKEGLPQPDDGALYGSPLTMSPEQAQGDAVDARADLYGLGATLYNAVTGHPPFEGTSVVSILMDHMSAPVPDPREERPELSAPLAELIMRLLAKDAAERPQSAVKALALLEEAEAAALEDAGVTEGGEDAEVSEDPADAEAAEGSEEVEAPEDPENWGHDGSHSEAQGQ